MPYKSRRLKHRAKKSRKPLAVGILAVVTIVAILIGVYYVFFVSSQPNSKYGLFVGVVGSGSANMTGTQTYNSGTTVAVQATPGSGKILAGWLVNGTSVGSANPYVVTMSENHNLTAVFTSDRVLLQTSMGDITVQLRNDMPITTANFRKLVLQGIFDGSIFHRVIEDFMIQGGDPTGTGFGDPSIPNIEDEFSSNSAHNRVDRGTIAMANTGAPDSGSSQFFISVVYNSHLDNKHPVFGDVIEGMDVVDAISKVARDASDKPLEDVIIIKAEILP